MKTIVLSPSAARAFEKMAPSAQMQLSDAPYDYAMSGIGDTKAMVGTSTIRLRGGNFRIISDEEASHIVVLAIADRREIYG